MDHHPRLCLERRNYHRIERAMLGRAALRATTIVRDSFAGTMNRLTQPTDPDVIALTAVSALPLADAVRGYYDGLGLETPALLAVNANSRAAKSRQRERAGLIADEADRIGPAVEGRTVGLIDQFVGTGGTLELGRTMLIHAGAREVRAHQNVQWYDQAAAHEIDFDALTSEHADFMFAVGQKAARGPRLTSSATM